MKRYERKFRESVWIRFAFPETYKRTVRSILDKMKIRYDFGISTKYKGYALVEVETNNPEEIEKKFRIAKIVFRHEV